MYGIQYLVGATPREGPLRNRRPLTSAQFLDLARDLRLGSIEISLAYASPRLDPGELREYGARAREAGLRVVVAGPNLSQSDDMPRLIPLCPEIGADILRCITSGLLCGDRGPVGGYSGWQAHVERMIGLLRALAPLAEAAGVRIGVENHQDADSGDLLRICESVGSPNVGVTLDTGNPLAVGEDPVEFARRILDHLVDVHLKDYRMINTPEGYRLVHCAIGDGVVDFAGLWRLFAQRPGLPLGIEMAALYERHIRVLSEAYWSGLGARDVRSFVPVLRLWRERGEDAGDWRTPIELEDVSAAQEWERGRLRRSVDNLARLEPAGQEA
jgi:sugar phosphate isomerase/epimerase